MQKTSKILAATRYFDVLHRALRDTTVTDGNGVALSLDEGGRLAVDMVLRTKSMQEVVFLVGNGGSAAIAAHMHNDLCCAVGLRALVFTEAPLLTALANDHGYNQAYERPLRTWAGMGGLLVAISSSGMSENILRAARTARENGMKVVTMSGFSPANQLRHLGHVNFYVASTSYGYVELAHSALAHYLTDSAASQVHAEAEEGEARSIPCAMEERRPV